MASPNNNELLRQIALLSGSIDQHKSGRSSPVPYNGYARGRGKGIFPGRGRGRGGLAQFPQRAYGNMKLVTNSTPIKDTPRSTGHVGVREHGQQKQVEYALSPAGPGWKAAVDGRQLVAQALPDERNANNSPVSRNLTMSTPKSGINAAVSTPPPASGWITKRTGKNMQLISRAVLPSIAAVHAQTQRTVQAKKERKAAMLATLKTERLKEKMKRAKTEFLNQGKTVHVGGVSYIKSRSGRTLVAAAPARKKTVIINGVDFIMDAIGRKLVRKVEDPSGGVASTNLFPQPLPPKRLNISGDLFVRTRKGNLVRAPNSISTTPARRYATSVATTGSRKQHTMGGGQPRTYCQFYNRFGKCKKGYLCQYLHDPKRIALCTRHLKDACPHAASECTFSHLLIPEKVPLCTHFARGKCSKENCKYLHSKVSSTADVCRAFAKENYCENGARCKNRHVMECPDFAKGGKASCPDNKKCRLFHMEKGTKRKRSVDEHATERDHTARRLDAGSEPFNKSLPNMEPQEDEEDDSLFPDFESQEGDIDEQVLPGSSETNASLNDDDDDEVLMMDFASGEESANQKDDEKEYDTDELIYDEDEDEDDESEAEEDEAEDVQDQQVKIKEGPKTYISDDDDFLEDGDGEYGFGANYLSF